MHFIKKIFLSACAVFFASTCLAQSGLGTSFFDELVSDWHNSFSLEGYGECVAKTDIHGATSGTFQTQRYAATLKSQGISESKKHALTAYVQYSRLEADFGGSYSADAPFDNLDALTTSFFYVYNIERQWSAFAFGSVKFSAENAADWNLGATGFVGAGALYAVSESLSIGFGAAAYSRLSRDWIGIPTVFVQWRITEKLSLKTFSGATLLYDYFGDGSLVFDTSIEYANTYSRLSDGGVLRDSCWLYGVGATWKPAKHFYIGLHVGANFARELDFKKSDRRNIDADAAPMVFLSVGIL